MSGSLWQRILQHQKDTGLDPRGVSEIGRLARAGELTVAQAVAAHRLAEIYGRYERIVGLRRSAKSFSYDAGFGGFGVDDHLLTTEQIEARDKREISATEAWEELQKEMIKLPRALRDAVETLCVEDLHASPVLYEEIRHFLNRLAVSWQITNRKRASQTTAGARAGAITAQTHVVTTEEPARPKVNVERVAFFKAIRILRPDLVGDDLHQSFDLYRALKDKIAHRLKADRKRIESGKGAAYVPPEAAITPTAAITNRPVLTLPGQQEHA